MTARDSPIHEDTERAEKLLKSDVKSNKQKQQNKSLPPHHPPKKEVANVFLITINVNYLNILLLFLHNGWN